MSEVKFTKGPWKVEHMGGSSTVLVPVRPRYNNTSTPSYGYRDGGPFSVATIFQEDGGHIRRDFVSFSHDDANLIAAAPELYEALDGIIRALKSETRPAGASGGSMSLFDALSENEFTCLNNAECALAKARGETP